MKSWHLSVDIWGGQKILLCILRSKLNDCKTTQNYIDWTHNKYGGIATSTWMLLDLDRGLIRSSLRDGLNTPYRLTQKQCLTVTPYPYPLDNGATSEIDNVLIEHVGIPNVLPLSTLIFLGETILRHSFSLSFLLDQLGLNWVLKLSWGWAEGVWMLIPSTPHSWLLLSTQWRLGLVWQSLDFTSSVLCTVSDRMTFHQVYCVL